jgi:HPt (histidine-containing phosphotransfer) domain-containing protein
VSSGTQRLGSTEVRVRLEALYERVRQSFAENLTTIDEATHHLETGALDDAERRAAERAAHRLVGAAETVGYPEATAPARRLEDAFAVSVVRPDRARRLRIDAAALHRILLGQDGRDS